MTYNLVAARASAATSPITRSITVGNTDGVLIALLKVVGGTDRAGGAPTWNGITMTQVTGGAQKAATSPEAIADLWFLLNPHLSPATANFSLPNTGSLTIFSTLISFRIARPVNRVYLVGGSGANGTSADPSPGSLFLNPGDAAAAIAASGATTWNGTPQAGTAIANTDDGAHGGGEQYSLRTTAGSFNLNWTQASDDWGAVVAAFAEAVNSLNNYKFLRGSGSIAGIG